MINTIEKTGLLDIQVKGSLAKKDSIIYKMMSFSAQPIIFFTVFTLVYLLTPLILYCIKADVYMLLLAKISTVAALGLVVGYFFVAKRLHIKPMHLGSMSSKRFIGLVFLVFLSFIFAVTITAENVPLALAFKTRDVNELAVARAKFLKAREGVEIIFVYLNAVLTSSFLPYIISLSFFRKYNLRWFVLSIPYFYSFLFIEKACFLKFILPFLSYCSAEIYRPHYKKYFFLGVLSIPLVIYINTVISGFGSASLEENLPKKEIVGGCNEFYSAHYNACADRSPLKFIAWRVVAVPVFTATDSLKLFEEKYKNQLFWGRTSSMLSFLLGMENIKFEREIFSSEWGQDKTGTSSSNAVFVIEQFINFGWLGVLLASIFVGYLFAILKRSPDLALASISIVLSISLLTGGLIATMLSGGYLALFLFLFFVKLTD